MIKLTRLRAAKFKQLDDLSLAFPDRGSVLIQGLNEAGKSTLFEAVYFGLFGRALVTEEPNRLDDLINYQSPRAMVKLAFSTDGATFVVSRTLNRGKPNTAVLEVEYAGGKRETVTNLSNVNRRIVDELGLDAEALLNSCFVEQKKLEKLESMTAQQRRETLLRLLNLDRLSALELQYKPSTNDDYQLQQLRDKLRLAETQRDLPAARDRLAGVEAELHVLAALRLKAEIVALQEHIAQEQASQKELQAEASRVAAVLAQAEQLEQRRDLARAAGESLLAIGDIRAEIERVQQQHAGYQVQAERLPEIEADLQRLEALASELADLAKLQEEQDERRRRLAALAESRDRVARLRASIEEREAALWTAEAELIKCRNDVERAEAQERRQRHAELLENWLRIREVAQIAQEGERELTRLEEQLAGRQHDVAEASAAAAAARRTAFALGLSAALSVATGAALAVSGQLFGLAGLALATVLIVLATRFHLTTGAENRNRAATESVVSTLRSQVHRLEGEQALAQRTGQDAGRLADVEAELAQIATQPTSVADAQLSLSTLRTELETLPATRESAADLRQRLGKLEGQVRGLKDELAQLRSQVQAERDPQSAAAELEAVVQREELALEQRRGAILDGPTTETEARELAAGARAARKAALEAAQQAAQSLKDLGLRAQKLRERENELDVVWGQLQHQAPNVERELDACRALWRDTVAELEALDELALRRRAAEAGQAIAACEERIRTAQLRAGQAGSEVEALDVAPDHLAQHSVNPAGIEQREVVLQQEQRELLGAVASLRDRQAALEQQLSLQGVAVDMAEGEQSLAAFERQAQVRKQAYRIVTLARRNIVGKVLPSTIRNMGLLLPLLTSDRYRDVDIDPETYKIKVWDEAARAMKAKDIFSGGTRDQFSLALRLAFALATLPEELGTAPGFIFLDEPLSSFDTVRTNALVNLLTRGPVAANFEQIFVISHNRAFDVQLFDYHLHLDSGRIVDSDLPAPTQEPQQDIQLALVSSSPTAGAERPRRVATGEAR